MATPRARLLWSRACLSSFEGVVTLPQGTSARKMREELEALGEQIGCDIDLDPI